MAKRIFIGTLTVILFIGFVWLFFSALRVYDQETIVIGSKERIILITTEGEVEVVAKIDTGTDFSSIDERFARSLGFKPNRAERKIILTEQGREERDTLRLIFLLGNRKISSLATVADRSRFSTAMIIGKNDLAGLRIDASREFLTHPNEAQQSPLPLLFSIFLHNESGIEKIIILIPILGSVIVLLRLFAGIRTYGVFAPVVISLSLLDLDIIPGIIVYTSLLAIGISAKLIILNRLRLPHIAEFSLIMFLLVSILIGTSSLPVSFTLSFSAVFFPLIITSHLIEQASKTIEEHNIQDFFSIITATFATALLLTFFGSFLLKQSLVMLWVIFIVSVLVTVTAGNYLGLRFNEFIRFKFLKRNHVHK